MYMIWWYMYNMYMYMVHPTIEMKYIHVHVQGNRKAKYMYM